MKQDFKEATEQNKLLAHDEWVLDQEKAQLFGQMKQLQSTFVR